MRLRGRGDEGGQAAVELVLVLPLVVLVALAALQVALVGRDQVLVVHAAREAARQASLGEDDAVVSAAAARATALRAERVQVATRRSPAGDIEASVTYTSPTDVPFIGGMVGDVRLTSAVTMRREGDG